jgi:hypothetical protein
LILLVARAVVTPLAALLAPLFAVVARTGYGVDVCRRFGFQPVRLHYYQPIPRYETLPAAAFDARQTPPGFRIDEERVRETLRTLAPFGAEASWTRAPAPPGTYTATNDTFGFSSAALLHAFIRSLGTRKVIEVGGGFSSLITLAALERNHPTGGYRFECVEPYPSPWLEQAIRARQPSAMLVRSAVEHLDARTLADLAPNDVLFVDSSHCVRLASDVNFLFLEVLPRLRPGVIVHIHDIYIPYEYPRVHFFGRNKLFWNEQYMLQALLTENPRIEILLPGYFVQTDLEREFAATFPAYDPAHDRKTSSFWLRRLG